MGHVGSARRDTTAGREGRGARLRALRPLATRQAAFTACVVAVATGLFATVVVDLGPPRYGGVIPWWSLVVVFFAAESYALGTRGRSALAALSAHDACVVFGLFVAPPVGLVVAQLAGSALAAAAYRPSGLARTAVRLGGLALATSTALVVFHAVAPLGRSTGPFAWVAATVAVAAGTVAGFGLRTIAAAARAERPSPDGRPLLLLGLGLGGSTASSAIALAAVELVRMDNPAALLLVVPFVSCALVLRAYASERLRLVHLRELYESMRVAQGVSGLDDGVAELLASTRRLLRADVAWIVLLAHERSVRSAVAELSEAGGSGLQPATLTPFERELVATTLAAKGVVSVTRRRGPEPARRLLEQRGLRHALAVVLHGDEGPLGVLLVANRADEAQFRVEDVRLLETYAGHAGVLLENDRLEQSLSELTALKEQLRHQAYHDALTGLPNRALFAEHVARSLAAGARSAVLFLDLDDFKMINDSFGHHAGDALLVAVGGRVRACVRPGDMPARLGGDEFAVLARSSRPEEAEAVAERLVQALEQPFHVEGREIHVHASVGIAFGSPGTTANDLLRNADVAMYDAKQGGKRRFACYEPHMQERVRRRHELASALERSVERGEIAVHYQPIVGLADSRLVAVEALARWERPGSELLPPLSFIPLADEIGLMIEIGRVVLREACVQARAWQTMFPGHQGLTVNVNLAPSELHNPSLAAEVEELLGTTGLDPRCLVLEITESGVMHKPAAALRTMCALRALGVSLALDDFGTGHSSLAHLREFPLDWLKIAKPFVAGLPDGHVDAAFVETIVRLAGSLELGVVAEGIESAAQARAVAELGCGFGQGFFYGSPLGEIGVTPYLTAGSLPSRPELVVRGEVAA